MIVRQSIGQPLVGYGFVFIVFYGNNRQTKNCRIKTDTRAGDKYVE